jgi:hypothetical protein
MQKKVLGEPLVAPREPENLTQEGQGELPKQAIIVDLDSTLAILNDRHWKNYDEVGYDELNEVIYRLIVKYKRDGYYILIVTGRPRNCGGDTIDWLDKYHVPFDMLVMRPDGDRQPDTTLKYRAYNQFIKGKYEVEFVLEDRDRVVEMYREELHLVCFQVRKGNY